MKIITLILGLSYFMVANAFFMVANALGAENAQTGFFKQLSNLCGQAFAGKLVRDNSSDKRFRDKVIILHIRDCSAREIRMPMHVGDDHSRTFILTRNDGNIKLEHDHRHDDGHPDRVSMYGGTTQDMGTEWRQDFPINDFSRRLFMENDLRVSLTNIWTISIRAGQTVSYQLRRPAMKGKPESGRDFKIDFDLNAPVENPPVAWGHK